MTKTAVNRKRVRAFFEWTFDTKPLVVWAVVCAIVAGLCTRGEAYAAAVAALAIAGCLLRFRTYQHHKLGAHYAEVEAARRHDFSHVLQRSYEKIATDIRALQPFETHDTLAELSDEAVNDAALFAQLQKKSVFLFGKSEASKPHFKRVLLDNQLRELYSPIEVSILYLTAAELIVYTATLDLRTGDLPVETVHRLSLRDIVGIQSESQTIRYTRADDLDLFLQYEKLTHTTQKHDIVVRKHAVRVSHKDAGTSNLPVGVTAYTSGATGVLDGARFEEEKIERFASEIVTRLKDAKAGTSNPPLPALDWSV